MGLDLRERLRSCDGLAGFDFYFRNFGISSIDADHRRRAYGALLFSGVVNHQALPWFHLAQMLHGSRICYAIPNRGFFALQISEGIDGGFGFEEIVHGQDCKH